MKNVGCIDMKNIAVVCIAVSLTLFGCGGSSNTSVSDPQGELLEVALGEIVNETIIPTVEGFSIKSKDFTSKSTSFCTAPATDKLEELQSSWKSLSSQWYKLALYNFGPLSDLDSLLNERIFVIDPLRKRGVDYTNAVRTDILNDIASSVVLDEDYFRNKSFNLMGLLPLELLIFEVADSTHTNDAQAIVSEFLANSRKCEILIGMADINEIHANEIEDDWKIKHSSAAESYKSVFLSDVRKSIATMIVSSQSHLDYLSKRNIVNKGAQISAYSYENIQSSINEVKLILYGTSESQTNFIGVMSAAGAQAGVDTVTENIETIESAIQEKNESKLNTYLRFLDGNFKREIANGLGIALGINFSDGD